MLKLIVRVETLHRCEVEICSLFAMQNGLRIAFLCFTTLIIWNIEALKCRTREHMKQQQDFYNLASNCMKSSMNITSANVGQWDHHRNRPQNDGNRPNYDNNYYDTHHHQNNRYNRNKFGFRNHVEENANEPNTCNAPQNTRPNNYDYRNNDYKEDSRYQPRHPRRRDTMTPPKYVRKNSTLPGTKKSPLEEMGACVIHCIFREMKMLNSDSKADRQAITNIMTKRIQDPELREFIQDSIEECFDIIDTDGMEEQCEFSKKLILCLDEKAKRGCEDWEIPDNANYTSNFNFNKQFDDKNPDDRVLNQKYR